MRYRHLVTTVLLAAYLPACATYNVIPDPASTLRAPQTDLKQVRVTLRTGAQFNLRSPRVEGDSLRGTWPNSLVQSVALSDVAAVQVKRVSAEKTAGFILAVAALAGWALIGLWVLAGGSS